MPRTLGRLTATGIRSLQKRGYYADGGGLYFRVSEFDTRSWAFRFSLDGKAREMGLGPFPDVSLKDARELAAQARRQLREGVDPIAHRKQARSAAAAERATALTFEACAEALIRAKEPGWKNAKHGAQWRSTLATYVYPRLGNLLVGDIGVPHVVQVLQPIWTTKTETATRVRGRVEAVLDYATANGYRRGDNPARWRGHLDKLLAAPSRVARVKHHAALPYQAIGQFMASLKRQSGMPARALELAILTATRSGEVRGATWSEIDLSEAIWVIPGGRMKAGKEHRIPLSDAAQRLLRDLPREDDQSLLFPSAKGTKLSDMALSALLKRMGMKITAHGFRSTFRDWAGETTAYPREVIEHALAHQLKDKSEAAYARGTLFEKRRRLMADWAKYSSEVHTPGTVTPISTGTA